MKDKTVKADKMCRDFDWNLVNSREMRKGQKM
jgi:hypothetical protein